MHHITMIAVCVLAVLPLSRAMSEKFEGHVFLTNSAKLHIISIHGNFLQKSKEDETRWPLVHAHVKRMSKKKNIPYMQALNAEVKRTLQELTLDAHRE
jgi:hypothetical protein